jgi:hypothetical protein
MYVSYMLYVYDPLQNKCPIVTAIYMHERIGTLILKRSIHMNISHILQYCTNLKYTDSELPIKNFNTIKGSIAVKYED